jgi:hypothetical protein
MEKLDKDLKLISQHIDDAEIKKCGCLHRWHHDGVWAQEIGRSQ